MKSTNRKIEKILAWIANIILISVVVLMYTGFFKRQLEAIFLTPEFVRLTNSSLVDTFFLYTKIDVYGVFDFFLKIINFSFLLLATFTMKYRIFSGVLFLFLALMIAGITSEAGFPVYLLYFIVAFMLFIRKG